MQFEEHAVRDLMSDSIPGSIALYIADHTPGPIRRALGRAHDLIYGAPPKDYKPLTRRDRPSAEDQR